MHHETGMTCGNFQRDRTFPEPRPDRGAEPFLLPMENGSWKYRLKRFFENPLGCSLANLHGVGQAAGKFDYFQIKKG